MSHREENNGLAALRGQLDEVDGELVKLAARRQQLVSEIGRYKQVRGQQLRDFRREREVIELVRSHAESADLDPVLAEDLFRRLIDASLARQEQELGRRVGRGDGQTALIIGGAGRMGIWLEGFLDNQGFDVLVADPAIDACGSKRFNDWREAPLDAAVIVVATPLRESAGIIRGLASRRVPGLVFDVGSLKSPLARSLREASEAGLCVTSIHPMFGPDTRLLSGRQVVFCDCGSSEAVTEARALFVDTMAEHIEVPLEDHDRIMAMVLGLSHALNIAFLSALDQSGIAPESLSRISSTTFRRQVTIARDVSGENPDLYHEIQKLNPHGHIARDALLAAVESLREAADAPDGKRMRELMEKGRNYLDSM